MTQTLHDMLAAIRRWKRANPEKVKQQKIRWRARHPNYLRTWLRRNPDKVNAYRRS